MEGSLIRAPAGRTTTMTAIPRAVLNYTAVFDVPAPSDGVRISVTG